MKTWLTDLPTTALVIATGCVLAVLTGSSFSGRRLRGGRLTGELGGVADVRGGDAGGGVRAVREEAGDVCAVVVGRRSIPRESDSCASVLGG